MNKPKSRGHVTIRWEECKGCGLCVEACPQNVLQLSDKFNRRGYHPSTYQGKGCTGCGICFYVCPEPGAITVFKRWDLMEDQRYCPHCGKEQKVFQREKYPRKWFCSQCLQSVESEKEVPVK